MNKQQNIFTEIAAERNRQDKEWGGAEHDDEHSTADWLDFIDYQMDKIAGKNGSVTLRDGDERKAFIKIAALAVAALESLDRQNAV